MKLAAPSGLIEVEPPSALAGRVEEREYARLLGYRQGHLPDGRVREAALAARTLFDRRARPWALTRTVPLHQPAHADTMIAGGERWTSRVLARRLRRLRATHVVIALVSAGDEADGLASRAWREGRVDDGYFFDRLGAAVVEHLASWLGERLRGEVATWGLGLTASYAPGYAGWDVAEMPRVGRALDGGATTARFEFLDSGMIRPKSSLLTVFGVTEDRAAAEESWRRSGCAWCGLKTCDYRRGW